jgi:hypothetical protein
VQGPCNCSSSASRSPTSPVRSTRNSHRLTKSGAVRVIDAIAVERPTTAPSTACEARVLPQTRHVRLSYGPSLHHTTTCRATQRQLNGAVIQPSADSRNGRDGGWRRLEAAWLQRMLDALRPLAERVAAVGFIQAAVVMAAQTFMALFPLLVEVVAPAHVGEAITAFMQSRMGLAGETTTRCSTWSPRATNCTAASRSLGCSLCWVRRPASRAHCNTSRRTHGARPGPACAAASVASSG